MPRTFLKGKGLEYITCSRYPLQNFALYHVGIHIERDPFVAFAMNVLCLVRVLRMLRVSLGRRGLRVPLTLKFREKTIAMNVLYMFDTLYISGSVFGHFFGITKSLFYATRFLCKPSFLKLRDLVYFTDFVL